MYYVLMYLLFWFSPLSLAADNVDVYGADADTGQRILKIYASKIQAIETQIIQAFLSMNLKHKDDRHLACLIRKKKQLLTEIKKREHFSYIDFETVFYPGDKAYTTVEVITPDESERMHFVRRPSYGLPNIVRQKWNQIYRIFFDKEDVIKQMQAYENLVVKLSISGVLASSDLDCAAYHCLSGFQHPALRPYRTIFQKAVSQKRNVILTTLEQDPDPQRRASAAYLVGYFSDPKEIVRYLSHCINDPAFEVRNHVLRVLASTLLKSQLYQVDATPFIRLLDSPLVTDRNKALTILLTLVNDSKNKQKIRSAARHKITELTYLKQPDNHDFAVLLLKKIKPDSGSNHARK